MKEEENIGEYLLRVDEVVNVIRGLGGKLKEREVADKVLRTFPMKYDSKVSTLEEQNDLDIVTLDELHGIITAYEMRTGQNDPSRKEVAFKAINESKKSEAPYKNHLEISDDEEALFIKKLERGTGKYKGNLPFKCFNYGRVWHFSNKCPYPKQKDSDHEESCCHKDKTMGKKKFKKNKKNFYSKEDSDDENENGEILFIGTTDSDEK